IMRSDASPLRATSVTGSRASRNLRVQGPRSCGSVQWADALTASYTTCGFLVSRSCRDLCETGHLWLQQLAAAAFSLPEVDFTIVQTMLPMRPELDRIRAQAKSQPSWRAWDFAAAKISCKSCHTINQRCARAKGRTLIGSACS